MKLLKGKIPLYPSYLDFKAKVKNGSFFKSKLILGTAQFGMPYGLVDHSKIIKVNKLNEILKYAKKNGINRIDTAINYGDIQQKLGKIGVKDFLIVSKIPKLSIKII